MTTPSSANRNELLRRSGVEIAAAVRARSLSAVDVLEAYLAEIAARNAQLNAIVVPRFDEARAEARRIDEAAARGEPLGPLAGVPVTVKDCFDVVGTPSTIGVAARKDHRPDVDAPTVERFRRAGAVIVGKTNVPQLMLMYETENRLFGRTVHPENPSRGAGGSSGGEAAAIAARFAAFGLASDLLGSIRQPAHVCGVHGFKPTAGRTSMLGTLNVLRGMEGIVSQAGPIARHMADVVAASRLLLEEPYDDPFAVAMPWRDPAAVEVGRLRVGVWESDPMFPPSPAIRRVVREAADRLQTLGCEVVPFALPDAEEGFRYCISLLAAGAGRNARHYLARESPLPGVELMLRLWSLPSWIRRPAELAYRGRGQTWRAKIAHWGRPLSAAEYWDLLQARKNYVRRVMQAWIAARLDVVLAPPHGLAALRHGTATDSVLAGVYAFVPNLLGVPSGTLAASRVRPGEESDRPDGRQRTDVAAKANESESVGLPVGLQVMARLGRDDVALAVMSELERHFAAGPDYPPK